MWLQRLSHLPKKQSPDVPMRRASKGRTAKPSQDRGEDTSWSGTMLRVDGFDAKPPDAPRDRAANAPKRNLLQ